MKDARQTLRLANSAIQLLGLFLLALPCRAVVLWSDLGATLAHETGPGTDILGGALRRDDASTNTLYFKFHVDPLSDVQTEEYFAAFELFQGDTERLAVGNSLKAWAYSAFNTAQTGQGNKVFGDVDLRSARPEHSAPGLFLPYELPKHGIESTLVFKVQYQAGTDDVVTVWLNPDLSSGATEQGQSERLTTQFRANASFDQIRLRHGGGGGGWTFSDMAIATAFTDFVGSGVAEPGSTGRAASAYSFRSWQREQGLPQNSVHALAQTRDGYLWLGSDDGVTRFDGVRFVPFGLREGLGGGGVRVLFEDSAGALWLGTQGGGLTRYKDGRFTAFTTRDGLPSDSITALAEDNEQRLWVGTEAGLVVRQDGHFSALPTAAPLRGKRMTTLFKDHTGVMWVGAVATGLFRFAGGKFDRLAVADPFVEALLKDPHCLLDDRTGRLWVGAGDDFVLCRQGRQWYRYRIPRQLARPYVSALAEEPDGTVWAGSVSEGLFEFKEGRLSPVNAGSGLSDNFVGGLLVDREGNLWVGTSAGLTRLKREELLSLGPAQGLGYGPVQGLAEVAPGVIWAARPGDGVYRWKGRTFRRLATAEGMPPNAQVNTLLAERGACWAGTSRGLLHFTNAADENPQTEPPALAGRNITALGRIVTGALVAGTRSGELWVGQHGHWSLQTNLAQPILALAPTAAGAAWIGTDGGGAYELRGTIRLHLDRRNGLLSDRIRGLYVDSEGALWIGTAGGGLSLWRQGRLTTWTTHEGLPDNSISQILEDDAGGLWLGSNRGLARVNKAELEAGTAGKLPQIYPQLYGRPEGMNSEECTSGFGPAGLKTRSGQLWFSTLKGIVVAQPRLLNSHSPAPEVALEEILVDSQPAQFAAEHRTTRAVAEDGRWAGERSLRAPDKAGGPGASAQEPGTRGALREVTIGPGKHRLEFHYTGLSFTAPERVRFRYRLEPLDPEWVEAGARRTAYYPYVPPGQYLFRVTACNDEGAWNPIGTSVLVTVRPYLWQSRWFLVLVGLGLLGSVGGAVRLIEKRNLQRRLAALEQERTLERERARIAQDLHDELGASLTRVSLLSELVKADKESPRQVEAHADKISQSASQTVRSLEEIVWALRPGSDSLQSLVEYIAHFATELFEGDRARCRLDLQRDLPECSLAPDVRHNLFLIIKEALTNALKHAGATEVRVQAHTSADSMELGVQDDGRGFQVADAAPQPGKRQGLGNMRRRAQALGATLQIESRPGGGTIVRLFVPLTGAG